MRHSVVSLFSSQFKSMFFSSASDTKSKVGLMSIRLSKF